ncbi:hypothetical protein V2H29_11425 [Lysinibacillus fusiformis]|jgi:hypothetical protein|uniref:hypothetical protein n=1 Tax=Lysinibacillus fusiformis TaxID=28031 RepID=UPI002EC28399|nr:hypothetical protein [Lysinibacillus fusiformis]
MFIVFFILLILTIVTTIFVSILLKKKPLISVLVLALICVTALFTRPSETTYYNELAKKHGLQCYDNGTCTAGQHVYTVEQFSSHNLGLFTTYHLKMTYGGGTHLREIDSIGAFYNIFTYTNR